MFQSTFNHVSVCTVMSSPDTIVYDREILVAQIHELVIGRLAVCIDMWARLNMPLYDQTSRLYRHVSQAQYASVWSDQPSA